MAEAQFLAGSDETHLVLPDQVAVGKADDILGPIPTAAQIKEQVDELDRMMDNDRKESEELVKTSVAGNRT